MCQLIGQSANEMTPADRLCRPLNFARRTPPPLPHPHRTVWRSSYRLFAECAPSTRWATFRQRFGWLLQQCWPAAGIQRVGKKSSENNKEKKGRTRWMGSSIIFVILVLWPHVCRTTWFHTVSPFRVLQGSAVRRGLTVQAIKEQFSNWAAFEFTSLQNKAAEIIRGGREAPVVPLVAQKNNLQLVHDDVVNAEAIPREFADALQGIFRSNCVQ